MYSDNYWICFKEAERPLWFMRWLKKGFSHCFCISVTNGLYIKYDCGHGITRVDASTDFKQWTKDCIIVKIKGRRTKRLFYFNTCVGFVKAVTGLKTKAVTPYQLYKAVRNGIA